MKVKEVIKALEELSPDEEICVLWWERATFRDVPVETWNKLCDIFDRSYSVGDDVSLTIVQTLTDLESETN